jgi:two-component sensor histidine kinase
MLLAAEANHRIANNLTALAGLVRLKARRVSSAADAESLLLDISGRIETVGRLHRLLATTKSGNLNVSDYLSQVCEAMQAALGGGKEIAFDFALDGEIEAPPEMGLPLGMLTAELVTNSVKYAHPTGVALQMRVSCARTQENAIDFGFEDDGVGFPEGFRPEEDGGFGLQLIHSLVGQLRGACAWRSNALGLGFTLTAPITTRRSNGHAPASGGFAAV